MAGRVRWAVLLALLALAGGIVLAVYAASADEDDDDGSATRDSRPRQADATIRVRLVGLVTTSSGEVDSAAGSVAVSHDAWMDASPERSSGSRLAPSFAWTLPDSPAAMAWPPTQQSSAAHG